MYRKYHFPSVTGTYLKVYKTTRASSHIPVYQNPTSWIRNKAIYISFLSKVYTQYTPILLGLEGPVIEIFSLIFTLKKNVFRDLPLEGLVIEILALSFLRAKTCFTGPSLEGQVIEIFNLIYFQVKKVFDGTFLGFTVSLTK